MKKAENLVDKIEKFSKKSETKEAYVERVLNVLDRAFHDTGKSRIELNTDSGTVCFTKDPSSGGIEMFVNDERIAPSYIASRIAEIDHVGEENAENPLEYIFSKGNLKKTGKHLARRGIEETIKDAKRQSEDANKTTNAIMHSLIQMLMMAKIR